MMAVMTVKPVTVMALMMLVMMMMMMMMMMMQPMVAAMREMTGIATQDNRRRNVTNLLAFRLPELVCAPWVLFCASDGGYLVPNLGNAPNIPPPQASTP